MTNDELYHHGILGMKWGQRRYQDKNGKLTAAGRKRYGGNPIKKFTTKLKRKKALEKARKTREENRKKAEELKKNKEEWAKDPSKLKAHLDEFTNDELREAINRLQLQKSVSDLKLAKLERGKKYVDLVGGIAKDATQVAVAAKAIKTTIDEFNKKQNGDTKNTDKGTDEQSKPSNADSPKKNEESNTLKSLNDALTDAAVNNVQEHTKNYYAAYVDGRMSKGAYDMAVSDITAKSLKAIDKVSAALEDSGIDTSQFDLFMRPKKGK